MSALAAAGPDAVRIEALAKGLGVSKGGFYWHFEDRRALIEETLEHWERAGTDDVIAAVDGGPGDGRAKVRRLFELAPSAKGLFAVELALRDWSRRDRDVARRLRRVDDRRLGYLRSLFGQFCAGRRTSRPAPCWPTRCSSAATSSPPRPPGRPAPGCRGSRSTGSSTRAGAEMTPRPVLLFDGDCAFCTSCARLLERRVRPAAAVVAWQFADLAELGVSAEQATAAVQWIGADGRVRSGHEAIAAMLATAGPLYRPLGRFLLLPGVSAVAARAYALIAANRYRLPGGTPACRL